MQFKYPELLWALFLLLIPIFIHLFRLRRFKRTPFTNVRLLRKVVSESRKSNTLKKWLLLFTRLLLFSAIILAFAQPFLANPKALAKKETVIYLDNSFSMWAKQVDGTLIENAVQDLLKSIPGNSTFSLFTNTDEYRDVRLVDIQNTLLAVPPTAGQLNMGEIGLKARTFFSKDRNTVKNLIVISDFQNRMFFQGSDIDSTIQKHYVRLSGTDLGNIAIDSCYISKPGIENTDLKVFLSASPNIERTPVSLYNKDRLIAKTAAIFEKGASEVTFTIAAGDLVMGRIGITDKGLPYDNHLYFNIDQRENPKILVIGDSPSDYLRRIYTHGEFDFASFSLKDINYRDIENQNLIILNGLGSFPSSLIASISSFVDGGGSLVVIPSQNTDIASYNQLLANISLGRFIEGVDSENPITTISFAHPLYDQVFKKSIRNFQYPKVNRFYKLKSNAPSVLSYRNGEAFLVGDRDIYLFTADLDIQNSNFQKSPLIVPTFLKMGMNSLKHPEIYYVLDSPTTIDIPRKMAKDHILRVSKGERQFIPQQKNHANKVSLHFNGSPNEDGIFTISENGTALRHISFNYPRQESELVFMDLGDTHIASKRNSITTLFKELQNDNRITGLWKWFVILALFFMLIEVLIIKFLK